MAIIVGYARVSTTSQHLDMQLDALTASGCTRIHTDTASGALSARPGLDQALTELDEGDTLVVWRLDRLGRSLPHLLDTNAASAGAHHQEDNELYIYSYATPARFDWEAIDILKAISCYEYQASEAPGWDTSTAKAFCEVLRRAVIPALPGYTDAPWEITTTSTPAHTAY